MAKKINPGSKSSIRQFTKEIEKAAMKTAVNAVKAKPLPVKRPHCGAGISVPGGMNVCPACGNGIDLQINSRI